ncbi:GNAT family N-acetyltransferase [Candidatus Entotheonella palauensis]|uniref:GNAT family N-acetyltransferase n=1 Tax=Candidatus Entotheonella palauensis TaxID=93172 RepID=UPI0030B9922A
MYQRYGYAHATHNIAYTIDPQDIRFITPPTSPGMCRRYTLEDGFALLRQLYIDFIAPRMLYLHRSRALWHNNTLDADAADGPLHVVVYHDEQDVPQGYMVYTTCSGKVDHQARSQEMVVRDLVWLTQEAYLELWRFITQHDLVGRVRFPRMPPDDPAAMFLQEPRLLHTRLIEGTWLRVTQTTGALTARHYTTAGHLAIEVAGDDLADWNNGVVELETDGIESQVKPSTASPDICLGPRGLAMLYSGIHTARQLLNWGLLHGTPEGVVAADRLFQTQYAPHCPDHF